MTVQSLPDHPMLQGPFQPLHVEHELHDLPVVQGEIPRDISGAYYRIGPNLKYRPQQGVYGFHMGDGMAYGLYLENGKAHFKNRWVNTPKLALEDSLGRGAFEWEGGFPDHRNMGWERIVRSSENQGVPAGVANTNIVWHGSQLLAMGEDAVAPLVLDPESLETTGIVNWSNQLGDGVTPRVDSEDGFFCAHPKIDPVTGEMFGYGFSTQEPYLTYYVVSADGKLTLKQDIDAPFPAYVHDMFLTETHVVIPLFPTTFRHERVERERCIMGWEPDLGTQIAVIPRDGGEVKWFEGDSCYVLHTGNAYAEDNRIVCVSPEFPVAAFPADGLENTWKEFQKAVLTRWTLDLDSGGMSKERLDDRSVEFPRMDERHMGRDARYLFDIGSSDASGQIYEGFTSVIRYDLHSGASTEQHDLPAGSYLSEAIFVPRRENGPEGEGYLMLNIYRFNEDKSDYVMLDAENLSSGPLATIALPHRVPFTPHGNWRNA